MWELIEVSCNGQKSAKPRKSRSRLAEAIHEPAAGLLRSGLIDKGTMREFDASCLTVVEPLSAKETPPLSSRKPPKAAIRDP